MIINENSFYFEEIVQTIQNVLKNILTIANQIKMKFEFVFGEETLQFANWT